MSEQYVAAFNRWMDDFTNNPEQFSSITADALNHLREKLAGKEPSYGQSAAATFEAYLAAA
jgi:hypothetical protein